MIRISHSSCQPVLNHSHDHENRALTTNTERLTLTVWHPEEHFKFISASTSHMTDQVKVQRFCHVILKRGFWAPLSLHFIERSQVCASNIFAIMFNQLLQSIKTDIVKWMLQRKNCFNFWLLMISSSYSDILLICRFSVVFQSVSRIWQTVGGPVAHWSLHRVAGLYGREMCREGKCTGLEILIILNLHFTFRIYMWIYIYINCRNDATFLYK